METVAFSPELSLPTNLEINILCGLWDPRDGDLFFGPLRPCDVFLTVPMGTKWAHILKVAGVFSSVREAKGNGWDRIVEPGFTTFRIGKTKRLFASLNVE